MNPQENPSKRHLSVLVVDDEESLRCSLVLNLQASGYTVSETSSPIDALEILQKCKSDIILSDLRMPEMDGFDFIEKCKEIAPDSAVVLMTDLVITNSR